MVSLFVIVIYNSKIELVCRFWNFIIVCFIVDMFNVWGYGVYFFFVFMMLIFIVFVYFFIFEMKFIFFEVIDRFFEIKFV